MKVETCSHGPENYCDVCSPPCVRCGLAQHEHQHHTKTHEFTLVEQEEPKQPTANDRQVGGTHYQQQAIQHWDWVAANGFDYFQGQVTKYVSRWRGKNGLQDLEKARHFLDKYIELVKGGVVK